VSGFQDDHITKISRKRDRKMIVSGRLAIVAVVTLKCLPREKSPAGRNNHGTYPFLPLLKSLRPVKSLFLEVNFNVMRSINSRFTYFSFLLTSSIRIPS